MRELFLAIGFLDGREMRGSIDASKKSKPDQIHHRLPDTAKRKRKRGKDRIRRLKKKATRPRRRHASQKDGESNDGEEEIDG